jgi:hypothetical protein
MADTLPPTTSEASAILDSLLAGSESKRGEEEAARRLSEEHHRRLQEHAAHRDRLAAAFSHAHAFPGEERERGGKPNGEAFARWAERFVALGAVLVECDEAIQNLSLRARLREVAGKTAPAPLKFACALLLLASDGKAGELATALERANGDQQLRRFVLWLPFIRDNFWRPYPRTNAITVIAESPDGTTREENEEAGRAFGCQSPILQIHRMGSMDGANEAEVESEAQTSLLPSGTSGVSLRPRWNHWALGVEAGNKWHLFRQVAGEWRPQRVVGGISKGRQAKLMKAFADRGGFLAKVDALKLERPSYSAGDIDRIMNYIKPELARLRETIRKATGVQNTDTDPLPFDGARKGWQAVIQIGYAVQEDGEHVGGEKRLRFKVRAELTQDESADR